MTLPGRAAGCPAVRKHQALSWSVSSSGGEYAFYSLHIGVVPPVQYGVQTGLSAMLAAKHLTWAGFQTERDAACIRFAASLQPTDLEPFFAEGAHALGNNLDWGEANWQNRAYLDVLIEPTTPMTPMALLLLVVELAGKPGQTRWRWMPPRTVCKSAAYA
ncbi:MAG: hypothetical protein IPH37_18250 [Burkholderiales bacterium]|nr:hypothetical protein [Burkholderiales bacterium]